MEYDKKKQKKAEPNNQQEGDIWLYTCIKRESYLFVAYSLGKWTQRTCRMMFNKFFNCVELPFPDEKLEIFSDGNDDYIYVMPEFYAETCLNYGQIVKIKSGGKVIDKIKMAIYGNPSLDDIETTNVENFNGILRGCVGRLVRRSKCYSKKRSPLNYAVGLMQFYWNMIHLLPNKLTPAMVESISDHRWTWDEFLTSHYDI